MTLREAKPEELVAAWVDQVLAMRGFLIYKVERRQRACPHCGKRRTDKDEDGKRARGGDGVSKGVPDRLVREADWPAGILVGIELKARGGRWSSEEQEIAFNGGTFLKVEGAKTHGMVRVFSSSEVGDSVYGDQVVEALAEITERVA